VGFCTACGQRRRDGDRFCTGCGTAFHDTPDAQSEAGHSSNEAPPLEPQPLEPPPIDGPHGMAPNQSAPYSEAAPDAAPWVVDLPGETTAEDRSGNLRGADPYGARPWGADSYRVPPWADPTVVPAGEEASRPPPIADDPFANHYHEPPAGREPRYGEETSGTPFARRSDDTSVLPQYPPTTAEAADAPGHEGVGHQHSAGGGRRKTIVAVLVVIAVLAVGGAALGWEINRHNAPLIIRPTQGPPSPPAQQGATASPTKAPSGGPTLGNSTVAVAAGLAQNPDAPPVVNLLTSYFTAINAHDYQAFVQVHDQQLEQGYKAARFQSDYGSTSDSGVMLTGISTTADGSVAATTTFTSHQSPKDSVDHTACTHWKITLFLEQQNGGYVIGPPQPGYHAVHQAC
jgi:hypothetical protein